MTGEGIYQACETMEALRAMTDDQLVALSDGEVERLIDRISVESGTPLPPPLPPEPTPPAHKPDLVVYEVSRGLAVADLETAIRVVTLLRSAGPHRISSRCVGSGRGPWKDVAEPVAEGDYDWPDASTRYCFSAERWAEVEAEFKAYAVLRARWEEAQGARECVLARRKPIADEVGTLVQEARERVQRRDAHRAELARYLVLAEGDRATALRFYCDTHPGFEEAFPEVATEFLASGGGETARGSQTEA